MEYLLVRSDRDLSLTYEFISYEERAKTHTLEFKGRAYCGLKLKTESARNYAIMVGWSDITEEYNKAQVEESKEKEIEKKPKKTVRKPRKKTTTKKK